MNFAELVLILVISALASGLISARDLLRGYVRERRFPAAAAIIFAITVILTGIQFMYPPLLPALWRDPEALAAGQVWRILSPIFVHAGSWIEIAFDFTALAVIGVIANWVF